MFSLNGGKSKIENKFARCINKSATFLAFKKQVYVRLFDFKFLVLQLCKPEYEFSMSKLTSLSRVREARSQILNASKKFPANNLVF